MNEDQYLKWNERQQFLQGKQNLALFHDRELWWCSIGINVGHEENGKGERFARPIVIFKKFSSKTLWGIPVTTQNNTSPFYVAITIGDDRKRWAIVSQMRFFDSRRLLGKIGTISIIDYHFIQKAVTDISTS
jgi:mRNA interferase MazF